jgi:deoxyribodipyrimidine photo-lyase
MSTLFIFRRDLRLYDNTSLINADKNEKNIIPIFIFDPYQIENKNHSNNCVQFMIESLKDLKKQLMKYGSTLHTFYDKPWIVVDKLIKRWNIQSVYFNKDYSKYSKFRDKKIKDVCDKNNINLITYDDLLLNDMDSILTTTNKYYEKFTPYYDKAKKVSIHHPQNRNFKNLIRKHYNGFDNFSKLYVENNKLYIHGGRQNALKILKNISKFGKYNDYKNYPYYDTTLLSPHNKFGTISIRELYHTIKRKLGIRNELIRQLYWRDFYYNIGNNEVKYYDKNVGKYAKLNWHNDNKLYNIWKRGNTGIPIVDAGMIQLRETGWIHNRVRMICATMLTKIFQIDWRIGERYFQKYLIDYDITQNIMNWYWISGEVPFANPYFRILNPIIQTKKYDEDCKYSGKWIGNICEIDEKIDISKMIKKSIKKYK